MNKGVLARRANNVLFRFQRTVTVFINPIAQTHWFASQTSLCRTRAEAQLAGPSPRDPDSLHPGGVPAFVFLIISGVMWALRCMGPLLSITGPRPCQLGILRREAVVHAILPGASVSLSII